MSGKINNQVQDISIEEIMQKVDLSHANPDIYSNFAQISITINEFVLDFYKIMPQPGKHPQKPKAEFIQRINLPLTIIPGFVNAINTTFETMKENGYIQPIENDPNG